MVLLEFSMSPMDKGESVSEQVSRSLKIIDDSGVPYRLNPMGTVLEGEFDDAELVTQPILGLRMPTTCGGVPDEILNPRQTWDDPDAYDQQAAKLRDMFRANYEANNFAELGIRSAL